MQWRLPNHPGGESFNKTCPACGGKIVREAYLGGNIYYCPECQKLDL